LGRPAGITGFASVAAGFAPVAAGFAGDDPVHAQVAADIAGDDPVPAQVAAVPAQVEAILASADLGYRVDPGPALRPSPIPSSRARMRLQVIPSGVKPATRRMIAPPPSPPCTPYEIDIVNGVGRGAVEALSLFGLSAPDRVHPEDREAVQRCVDAALDPAGPGCFASEHRFVHADGVVCDILVTGRVEFSGGVGGLRATRATGVVMDVTERKREESALREREAHFRALAEHLPSFVWSANADGITDYYNLTLLDHVGKTRGEMRPAVWFEAIHPEDHPTAVRAWQDARRTGKPLCVEVRIRRASDGLYRWFSARAQPLCHDDGTIVRWLGAVVDVNDRVEAERAAHAIEEELRRTTQILNALLEASPVAIWAKDAEGRYLLANPAATESSGRSVGDVVGKTDAELRRPEDATALRANDLLVLTTGRISKFEEILEQVDGPHTYLSVKFPILDEGGTPCAVGGVATDITDRTRIEAALRESEERARERAEELETVLRTTPAGIWIAHDPECKSMTGSHAAHELLRVSDQANLSKSAPRAEHLGHFRIFHQGRELTPEELPVQRAARGEEILAHDYEFVFDDGTRRHVLGNAVPLRDRHGQPRGAVGAFLDVTELKLAEYEREQLLAREQAARAVAEAESRAKDEFLATVSHELRTPLNAILGWTQILLARGLPDEGLTRVVTTIERNARLQAQLVDDILDSARIVAGKVRLDARPVELVPLVQVVIESQQPAADAKGIRLSAELDPEVGSVLGDPHRLQQVIWNLVSNALKFTPQRGAVTVTLAREGSEALLFVRDTGVGIAPEFLPFVFQPFRQADAGASRRHGGLGLGLSIVRHFVQLHGGSVVVESGGHGQGSTFTVRLPLAAPGSVATEGPRADLKAKALTSLRGARVIVADDEQDSRALVVKILVEHSAVVRACASATEALDELAAWRPDVLVSDIGMPERDGYWLIERVRALPQDRGGATPALALTAYTGVEDRVRALAYGYQLHMPKPLDVNELVACVAALVRR
jgi:PAS domain S-box-containing protein